MSPYYGCLLFSIPVSLLYLLGALKHLSNHREENTCEMTYMFEYPQYVQVQLPTKIQQRFPRYGLYAYGEGFTLAKIRAMRFSGIPVLFIPGNAGSHHQVRSLASVSLRKSLKDRSPFHFDFFTVDFQGEYSALYGGVLEEQTEFVLHCIQKLLKFYPNQIESVLLIGHSMGGIVAKGVLLQPNVNVTQLNTIIMLATPHTAALLLDSSIAAYYQKLQDSERIFRESKVIAISVGGGPRDVVVSSNQVIDRTADLNILTTHVPGVWKSTDHLSILWCKEFVIVMVRALFDSVDISGRYPRISSDKEHRLKVLEYHLLKDQNQAVHFAFYHQRSAGKKIGQYRTKIPFESGGEWIEDIRRQYIWKATDQIRTANVSQVYIMIRLIGQQDRLTIRAANLGARDWLFACSASAIQGHSRVCEWGWNLTNKSRILPDGVQKMKTATINVEELKAQRLTHVLVRVPAYSLHKELSVGVDLHRSSDRIENFKSRFRPVNWGSGKLGTIRTSSGSIRHEAELDDNTDSVLLKIINVECYQPNYRHHAAVELLEPWTNISQVGLFTYQNMMPKILKVQAKNEMHTNGVAKKLAPILKFTLDPECVYTIDVWYGGLIETLATTVRDRWPNLYGATVGLLLLALAEQIDYEIGFINFSRTTTITVALCFGVGIGLEAFVALAILHIFAAFVCCAVVFSGSTVHNIVQRFLARALKFPMEWSDWILGGLNQLPLLIVTILLSVVSVTCGAVAMFLFIVLQFLNLIKLYEDYLENLLLVWLRFDFVNKFRTKKKEQSDEKQIKTETGELNGNKITFQLVLFLVWCVAAIPAIPSLLTWAKNYRYGARLETEVPLQTICWMVLISCGSVGVTWVPRDTSGKCTREMGVILRLLGWVALTVTGVGYPHQYQYLMPPLIAITISLVSIQSILQTWTNSQ